MALTPQDEILHAVGTIKLLVQYEVGRRMLAGTFKDPQADKSAWLLVQIANDAEAIGNNVRELEAHLTTLAK